jgi:simple sugar transport system permease protein
MWENIKNTLIKNAVNIYYGITALVMFLLIFVIPQFADGSEGLIDLILVLLFLTAFQVAVYKVLKFRKDNKNFVPSESKILIDAGGSIIAILVGLLFGFLLMLIVNPGEAVEGFQIIIKGGFNRGPKSLGNMIYLSVPIILTGLSVAFAFRTGLFNIGATGQLTMGAFVAVYIGIEWGALGDIAPILHWGVAVLGAMLAGALWGAIPGVLKAYRNVNEVVASIMLNYVAMYLNAMLIVKFIYNRDFARALDVQETAVTPKLNLDLLFLGSSINGAIVVTLIVVAILHVILNKTTFGFELKAVGFNRDASKYAGMNSKRNIVYSMMIAGAVSGLAGAMMFLVAGVHLKPDAVLIAQGFTGIAISLLGLSSPIGVLLAGLFYGSLQQGGYYLQLLNFNPEIIDIIIAVIIYTSALGLFLQKFVLIILRKKKDSFGDDDSEDSDDIKPELVTNEGGAK